jgi:IS30 family transposase
MPIYTQLQVEERKRIYVLLQQGLSLPAIAFALGRHRSTLYREKRRNRLTAEHLYQPVTANAMARRRREDRPLISRFPEEVRTWIKEKLNLQWSPEQISGRLLSEKNINVSHEWIYQFILKDRSCGGLLYKNLRRSHRKRKKRYAVSREKTKYEGAKSIEIRPEIANKRERLGDWEGDSIVGAKQQGSIVSLVERVSLFTRLGKPKTRKANDTRDTIVGLLDETLGAKYTLTFDRGSEFADYALIEKRAAIEIYFAHPYSSFERGTNENTNGLVRQYLPKKTDFTLVTDKAVQKIEDLLNHRPRKKLSYDTPFEAYYGYCIYPAVSRTPKKLVQRRRPRFYDSSNLATPVALQT